MDYAGSACSLLLHKSLSLTLQQMRTNMHAFEQTRLEEGLEPIRCQDQPRFAIRDEDECVEISLYVGQDADDINNGRPQRSLGRIWD